MAWDSAQHWDAGAPWADGPLVWDSGQLWDSGLLWDSAVTQDDIEMARIASGLVALANRMSVGDHSGPLLIAGDIAPALATALKNAIRVARDASQRVVAGATYRKPLSPGLGETTAMLCEAIAQALRHIGSEVPVGRYHDRMQLSEAASSLHNVYCQFAGPLRRLVTYSSLDDVYGATLSSNAMGGRAISSFREKNAFQELMNSVTVSPVAMDTSASSSVHALVSSDPVLRPLGADAVAGHLSAIAEGARVTA